MGLLLISVFPLINHLSMAVPWSSSGQAIRFVNDCEKEAPCINLVACRLTAGKAVCNWQTFLLHKAIEICSEAMSAIHTASNEVVPKILCGPLTVRMGH